MGGDEDILLDLGFSGTWTGKNTTNVCMHNRYKFNQYTRLCFLLLLDPLISTRRTAKFEIIETRRSDTCGFFVKEDDT